MKFFKKNFSQKLLDELSQNMEKKVFTPNEFVYKEGKLKDEAIYFVERGEIMIASKNYNLKKITTEVHKDGTQTFNSFGIDQFIFAKVSKIQAVSENFSTVYVLNRKKFLECLRKYPQD